MTIQEKPEHDIDFYKMTVDDIARTKAMQFQATYYSALVTGALVAAIKLFSDTPANPLVFWFIIAGVIANAVATTVFQFSLDSSLHKFRTRLRDLGTKLGRPNQAPQAKRARDLPLTFYFVIFPWGIALFAIWLACIAMSQ